MTWLFWVCAGCEPGATTLRLDVSLAAGEPAPQSITVALYGDHGALAADHPINPVKLPGKIEVRLRDDLRTVRAAVWGATPMGLVLGAAQVTISAGQEKRAVIQLTRLELDSDGDDVPDSIDDCDHQSNHDQADSDGDGVGDACSGDLGVASDLFADLASADLSSADLTSADLTTVIDLRSSDGGELLLGDTLVESQVDPHAGGLANSSSFQAISSGMVSRIQVFLSPGTTAQKVIVGLYTDNLGHPGTLLTSGSANNPVVNGWTQVDVPAVSVTAAQIYWLALVCPLGGGGFNFPYGGVVGPATEHSAESNLVALPATWTPGNHYPDTLLSIFATR